MLKKMNISFIILLFTGCLSLINTTNSSNNNNTFTMFILSTIKSSPSLIKHYLKRRSSVHVIYTTSNLTDDSMINNNISLSINKLQPIDNSYVYNIIKDSPSK